MPTFAIPNTIGAVAQVVEQWTENPCVAGSTPASTTELPQWMSSMAGFLFLRAEIRDFTVHIQQERLVESTASLSCKCLC